MQDCLLVCGQRAVEGSGAGLLLSLSGHRAQLWAGCGCRTC
jgi:hypothetical protein